MRRMLRWAVIFALPISVCVAPSSLLALSFEKGNVSGELTGFVEGNVTFPVLPSPPEDPSGLVYLEGVLNIGDSLRFKVAPSFSYDGTVLNPKDWNPVESFSSVYQAKPFLIELGEAYGQYMHEYFDLRVGIQKIQWGTLDEMNPTDNVNPEDFSKFVTFPQMERKIGIPMVKLDVFPKVWDLTIEGVWVPIFVPYWMPRPGERWFPPIFEIPATVDVGIPGIPPVALNTSFPEPDLPPRTFENSEAALRVSRTFSNVDFSLSYFYGYDTSNPVYSATGYLHASLKGLLPPKLDATYNVALVPRFSKINAFGFDLSAALGAFTIRSEWAYIDGAYYTVYLDLENVLESVQIPSMEEIATQIARNYIRTGKAETVIPLSPEISLKKNAVTGGIGADYLWGNHMLTGQVIIYDIFDYDPRLLRKEVEVYATLALRFSWLDDSLNADLAGMYAFFENSVVLSPEVSYKIISNLKTTLRFIYIDGPEDSMIGQYRNNDQVMLQARYSF